MGSSSSSSLHELYHQNLGKIGNLEKKKSTQGNEMTEATSFMGYLEARRRGIHLMDGKSELSREPPAISNLDATLLDHLIDNVRCLKLDVGALAFGHLLRQRNICMTS